MAQAKKNLGIRADHDRWQKINDIARGRETSVQKLVDEAINQHLFGDRASDSWNKKDRGRVLDLGEQKCMALMARAASVLADMISLMQDANPSPFPSTREDEISAKTKVRARRGA